ncbi:hypothetical protein DPEC_G00152110 [Dallia pectoralis]|uniref:Uncharacterized protein n=1 Tax=Dallia pectoralis TaxID=75939 RepID=A0ACC2GJT9_DALPE|nr:hypothetical protein DPEC_G00152110 [Dallia pectoralis]
MNFTLYLLSCWRYQVQETRSKKVLIKIYLYHLFELQACPPAVKTVLPVVLATSSNTTVILEWLPGPGATVTAPPVPLRPALMPRGAKTPCGPLYGPRLPFPITTAPPPLPADKKPISVSLEGEESRSLYPPHVCRSSAPLHEIPYQLRRNKRGRVDVQRNRRRTEDGVRAPHQAEFSANLGRVRATLDGETLGLVLMVVGRSKPASEEDATEH